MAQVMNSEKNLNTNEVAMGNLGGEQKANLDSGPGIKENSEQSLYYAYTR